VTIGSGETITCTFVNDDDAPPFPPAPTPAPAGAIDFTSLVVTSYAGASDAGTSVVGDGGFSLKLSGNAWKKVALPAPVVITSDTTLEFDVLASVVGEIQGLGFDTDDFFDAAATFQIAGTQPWGIQDYHDFAGSAWVHYTIPIGTFYTGSFDYLFFVNDDDAAAAAEVGFANVVVTTPPPATSLKLIKQVVNDNGGTEAASAWTLSAGVFDVTGSETAVEVTDQAGTYALTESPFAGYTNTSITCSDDPGTEVTEVTIGSGETITCTFVNDDDAPE
jgi:hypothetical protein